MLSSLFMVLVTLAIMDPHTLVGRNVNDCEYACWKSRRHRAYYRFLSDASKERNKLRSMCSFNISSEWFKNCASPC